jgi:hypothetical protein
MTEVSLYERLSDNSARFVLGTAGENPLICFGVNPSTATPSKLDLTVTRVREYANRRGNDSWVMLNLYAQRSTDPSAMHDAYLPELKAENERQIANLIDGRTLTLLAAWGDRIMFRPYLSEMLAGIVEIADASSCDWVSIGEPLKAGHPRHPSRGPYLELQRFDVGSYLAGLQLKL